MKVTNKMIAKELRLMGALYRPITSLALPKKSKSVKNSKKKKTCSSRIKFNHYIPRPDNTMMRLLIVKPQKPESTTGVLWLHGGGYVIGQPEMMKMSMAGKISSEYVLVSPEYTLATEKPFPAALDDCYTALIWMKEHADELGISPDMIIVGGESAGGGLTAALSLYARDKGEVNIICQIPLYPMLDDRMQTHSMINNNAPVWDYVNNKKAWNMYLDGATGDEVSKYAAAARETDYSELPPTITFAGDIEPFYDETAEYVRHLKKAGVPVAFKKYEGCFHAFDMTVPWSPQAKDAAAFVMRNLHTAVKKAEKKRILDNLEV
ncbi:MAG: alpha/beta hydrolase [Oscillospiraceae bacterium]|nr:alpha/beta hydrolase [Oscillospiraceae bacterium]